MAAADTALERTDIGAIDIRAMRKLFLRQAASPSKSFQVQRQYLSDIHAGEGSVLKSISPRSILYKSSRPALTGTLQATN